MDCTIVYEYEYEHEYTGRCPVLLNTPFQGCKWVCSYFFQTSHILTLSPSHISHSLTFLTLSPSHSLTSLTLSHLSLSHLYTRSAPRRIVP